MKVSLKIMTRDLCHDLYKSWENDPDIYSDLNKFSTYEYNEDKVNEYYNSKQDSSRIIFAIMLEEKVIGEIQLKRINYDKKECTLSIHMQNDNYKGLGYGTEAERLAIDYAINTLHMKTIYADTIIKNIRSQHVLEKVGFEFIKEENGFRYYQYKK